ncbi:MAG: SixA phosphatase family protein [Boseongicola sp.]
MTLKLILMRHAKSSWDNPTLDDFDRPLNARGNRDAPRIGRWLVDQGFTPEKAICSSAVRAKQTLDSLGLQMPVDYLPELYMASPDRILGAIQGEIGNTLLVVAHNPGMSMLAANLVSDPPNHKRFDDFPTASTLALSFEIEDWSSLRSGTGSVLEFVTPHDLEH